MPPNRNSAAFYNCIAPVYPVIDWFFRAQKRALKGYLNQQPTGTLLDLGVGDGSCFPVFTHHSVTGIDCSEKMLARARRRAPEGTQLLCGDIHQLPFPENQFDFVVLSHVIATVQKPEQVLAEAFRVLKTGGKLLMLNHFTPDGLMGIADRIFQPLSPVFRFNSVFREADLPLPSAFEKIHAASWYFGYFRMLVFEKMAETPPAAVGPK